jgi:hypothetical protein
MACCGKQLFYEIENEQNVLAIQSPLSFPKRGAGGEFLSQWAKERLIDFERNELR